MAEAANVDMGLAARVVSNGSAVAGRDVSFEVEAGSATLTSTVGTSDASGYARTTLQIRNLAGDVQVSACVLPTNVPCAVTHIIRVMKTNSRINPVAGSSQLVPVGQPFLPILVRTTDAPAAANPVEGALVVFSSTILRPDFDVFQEPTGESGGGSTPAPVILGYTQTTVTSDANGLASITPSPGSIPGPVEIELLASSGGASHLFELESFEAATVPASGTQTQASPERRRKLPVTRGHARPRIITMPD